MPPITPEHTAALSPAGAAPLDVPAVRAAVDRARRPLARPTRPELADLERQLRAHVESLLPYAEAAVHAVGRGSLAWYQRRERIDRIRARAGQGLGDSALSAHVQVRHLARDCEQLLDYVRAAR